MNQGSPTLEVEVKFHLTDPLLIRQRLDAIEAVAQPKHFETNVRFEDQKGSLIKGNQLLRLRQDSACRLTYKCAPQVNDSQCKVYQELEVTVSDFKTMTAVLNALGYQGVQVYEKWRQTFCWDNVLICMDTLPYGEFMEIEGPQPSIQKAAKALGLQWDKRILGNYLAIFETLRKGNHLPFNDVTFDNFKHHAVDMAPYLPLFEAGTGAYPPESK
jgi:adenylate cyclase, class 2